MKSIVITIFIILITSGCSIFLPVFCSNEVIQSVISPDKKYKLVIFNRNCGATTGFSTQISILNKNFSLKNEGGNIFIADDNHGEVLLTKNKALPIQVTWVSDREVFIKYGEKVRTFQKKDRFKGIKINYSQF
ncbi:MAG: DUF5412 family protein [Candidatus Caenarcaniphilales bacterium]|nr:DUF5412 family protein [Candidatus Caenarcaniphilales bacterium]